MTSLNAAKIGLRDRGLLQPGRFADINGVSFYWRDHYAELRRKSQEFSDAFYDSTLPPEVLEAVAATLTILKSPTVMRQTDGRLWAWDCCNDTAGCCHGSCTHVWNYEQTTPVLFGELSMKMRDVEYQKGLNDSSGLMSFRVSLTSGRRWGPGAVAASEMPVIWVARAEGAAEAA